MTPAMDEDAPIASRLRRLSSNTDTSLGDTTPIGLRGGSPERPRRGINR